MSRIWNFFILFPLTVLCFEKTETTPAVELTEEEIYNINSDVYCQTEMTIKEKLLDLENPINLYTSILGEDIKDIDCEAVLNEYVLRVHKRLRKDFGKKGIDYKTLNCYMDKIVVLGYDQARFKFNALYGIEIEKEKKDMLRKAIDNEIGVIVEQAVEACWQKHSTSTETDVEIDDKNNL